MLRIGTKLGIGIGVLLALCIVIGLVSYTQTRVVRNKVEEITLVREPVNSAVYALENNLVETAFSTLGYLSTGDTTLLAALGKNKSDFRSIEQRFNELADQEGSTEELGKIRRGFEQLQDVADEQASLRDLQAKSMERLFFALDSVDDLLTERIQASVSVNDPVAYRRLQAVLEMKVNVNAFTKGVGSFLLTGDPQFEQRVRKAERDFNRYFTIYQVVLLTTEEEQWSKELRRLSVETIEIARTIIGLDKQRREKLAAFLSIDRDLGSMLNDRIQHRTETNLGRAKQDVLEAGQRANTTIMLVLLFSITFGIIAGLVTTKNIAGPIRQLASVMQAIANGERTRKVSLRSGGELRTLGDAFNLMTERLFQANEHLRAQIAERQQAEDALRASEESFRLMIDGVRDYAIFMLDPFGRVTSWNKGAERMSGYTTGEILGRHFSIFYPEDGVHKGIPHELMKQAAAHGRAEMEGVRVRKDGSQFWANVVLSAVRDDAGTLLGYAKVTRDITEQNRLRRQLEEAEQRQMSGLRSFAISVQRAQEEERARISRELHDDLCQRLSGMKFAVEVITDRIKPHNRKVVRQLRDFAEELDRAISEVRRISWNLRPSVLDDFGLVIALKMLCKEFQGQQRIRTILELGNSTPQDIDPAIEIALYRIAQEALSNIAKHANASTATIHLLFHDSTLRLIVEDDGSGISETPSAPDREAGHGLGLISMRERTELLGGVFTVDSRPSEGTTISVTIPLGEKTIHEENKNPDR